MNIVKSINSRLNGIKQDFKSRYWEYGNYFKDQVVWEQSILFESFGGLNFQGNPYYIFKEIFLNNKYKKYDLYISHQCPEKLKEYLNNEGLPKVIQEAAQMRLPSIYINENYNVDFITDGINGFAVSDLETMQEKIQFLLDDPTTYQKMSKAAYESIQPYTWGNVIKQYEKYFEKIYEKSQKMGVL